MGCKNDDMWNSEECGLLVVLKPYTGFRKRNFALTTSTTFMTAELECRKAPWFFLHRWKIDSFFRSSNRHDPSLVIHKMDLKMVLFLLQIFTCIEDGWNLIKWILGSEKKMITIGLSRQIWSCWYTHIRDFRVPEGSNNHNVFHSPLDLSAVTNYISP